MKVLQYVLAVSLLLVCAAVAAAQDRTQSTGRTAIQMEPKPTNCEFHIATLDAAHHEAGRDGLVIVIVRLGDGEHRQDLNRRRLHNVKTYLVEFSHRPPATIITAVGERVKGYGRVELYVGGKLFYVLMIRSNADLTVGSCSYEGEDPCTHQREKNSIPALIASRKLKVHDCDR